MRFLSILICIFQAHFCLADDATYDSSTSLLTIPILSIGKNLWYAELERDEDNPADFLLTRAQKLVSSNEPRNAFVSKKALTLKLPLVIDGEDGFSWTFMLTKASPVTFSLLEEKTANSSCVLPLHPSDAEPSSTISYTEVRSNTAAAFEFGIIKAVAHDFNGDGMDDLFWLETAYMNEASSQEHAYALWISNGDGSFTEETMNYIPDEIFPDNPRHLFKADIDGDYDHDIVVLQHGYDPGGLFGKDCGNVECPGAANMLLSIDDNGLLRDVAPTSLSPYITNGFTHAGGLEDIDCDGDVDLLEGRLPNGIATATSAIQVNIGNGFFEENSDLLPAVMSEFGMYGTAFCDFDQDGDPDLYTSALGVPAGFEYADQLLINDGFGDFSLTTSRPSPESRVGEEIQRPADMQCVDYDKDGFMDILKPNEADIAFPAFELLHNNGDLSFTDVTDEMMPQTLAAAGSFRPWIVDLNGDNWPDILAGGNGDTMRIYWNNGNGFDEYIFPPETAFDTRGAELTPGDYDGDGDLDIHISRSHFESFVLFAD